MHKIICQRKRNELQNMLMLNLPGMPSSSNIGTCRRIHGFTACAVKNNLRSGIHTDRKAQNLNCYFCCGGDIRKQMYNVKSTAKMYGASQTPKMN